MTHHREATSSTLDARPCCDPALAGITMPCEVAFVSLHKHRQELYQQLNKVIDSVCADKNRASRYYQCPILLDKSTLS